MKIGLSSSILLLYSFGFVSVCTAPKRRDRRTMASTVVQAPLPEIVVFGASMAEWSFREKTQGYGLFLEKMYAGKARVVNEGIDCGAVVC